MSLTPLMTLHVNSVSTCITRTALAYQIKVTFSCSSQFQVLLLVLYEMKLHLSTVQPLKLMAYTHGFVNIKINDVCNSGLNSLCMSTAFLTTISWCLPGPYGNGTES